MQPHRHARVKTKVVKVKALKKRNSTSNTSSTSSLSSASTLDDVTSWCSLHQLCKSSLCGSDSSEGCGGCGSVLELELPSEFDALKALTRPEVTSYAAVRQAIRSVKREHPHAFSNTVDALCYAAKHLKVYDCSKPFETASALLELINRFVLCAKQAPNSVDVVHFAYLLWRCMQDTQNNQNNQSNKSKKSNKKTQQRSCHVKFTC